MTPTVKPLVSIRPKIAPESLHKTFDQHYRDKLESVPNGSGKARDDGLMDGWINGLSLYRILNPTISNLHPLFWEAIKDVNHDNRTVFQVLFNRLEPHAVLDAHIDGAPYRERYHLVLSGAYVYKQENKTYEFNTGLWYGPISYWVEHSVFNGDKERVVMIVDLE